MLEAARDRPDANIAADAVVADDRSRAVVVVVLAVVAVVGTPAEARVVALEVDVAVPPHRGPAHTPAEPGRIGTAADSHRKGNLDGKAFLFISQSALVVMPCRSLAEAWHKISVPCETVTNLAEVP